MIPLAIAEKLHLLANGGQMQASKLKHKIIDELIEEGIIERLVSGRTKVSYYITNKDAFNTYVFQQWSITNLQEYIATLKNAEVTRADLVQVSNDTKTIGIRTFKGFLVNSYRPVACTLNGTTLTVYPPIGTFQFISDYEHFVPAPDVVIAGVENAEVFSYIAKLEYLFGAQQILFVSRYPQRQGKDLIKWMQSIPNQYLHIGDYDFAGINIYMQEYKKYLGERASFFIPIDIEVLIQRYGNRKLYDQQKLNTAAIVENELTQLIALLHKHKKGLEQELLLKQ